jgi:DNA-binding response OmpR family regulator
MAMIYCVEDHEAVANAVCDLLHKNGHEAQWFDSPYKLFYQIGKRSPACVLVDWVLPEMTGIDVIARVRQLLGTSVGVLMLTAMDTEECVVQGLRAGADDYIIKPLVDAVLLARLDAVLRRVSPSVTSVQELLAGAYRFEFATRQAFIDHKPIDLTPREFDVAWTIFSQPGRLLTKAQLQAAIWGKSGELGYHTVAQHIYSVRKKLDLAQHGVQLTAVYGTGYRLELPLASQDCAQSAVKQSPA